MKGRRIAMWSGPRNISTAMMRAFENRSDCMVSDEPLYAHYLSETGIDHPGRDEIIADGETDWRRVVAALGGPIPDGKTLWYQKHMCHHLTASMTRNWIEALDNVLLIRDPAAVVISYRKARNEVSLDEIGLPQQAALFAQLADKLGRAPPVVDADEFLSAPQAQLHRLCTELQIPFVERMLSWPAGPRDSDGIWAPHWYAAVWRSTGFGSPKTRDPQAMASLDDNSRRVIDAAEPIYRSLHACRLRS